MELTQRIGLLRTVISDRLGYWYQLSLVTLPVTSELQRTL